MSASRSVQVAKSDKRSFLQPFYDGFNRVFGRFTDGYLSLTGILVRKTFRSALIVLVVTGLTVVIAGRIPGGFVPDEDNGYFFANVQLPDASSLERTDAVAKRVEEIIGKAPGVQYVTAVTGYSLVSGAYASNTAFLFVSLKPWEDRKSKDEHAFAIIAQLNQQLARDVPEAVAVTFGPLLSSASAPDPASR
jgi:HAE1 family hydrophobic/amphiphilic exporter-1